MSEDTRSIEETVSAAMEAQESKFEGVEPGPQVTATEPDAEKPESENESEREGRDEKGRFLQKAKDKDGDVEVPEDREQKPEENIRQDLTRPPKSLPIAVKQKWGSFPEEARAALVQHEASRSDYAGLDGFAAQAKQNGTNLARAFQTYSRMEDAMRANIINGVFETIKEVGHDPVAVFQEIARLVNGTPQAQANGPPQLQDPERLMTAVEQRMEQKLEQRQANAQIEAFANDPKHEYFDEVRPIMAKLVIGNISNTLPDAYEKACMLRGISPPLKNGDAAQTKSAAATNKARAAAKAVGGPPAHGSNVQAKARDSNRSLEQVVSDAMDAQEGR